MSKFPGDLRIVGEFVNTREIQPDLDDWATPEQLRAWLVDHGLIEQDAQVGPSELSRADDVREALRVLALSNNGAAVDVRAATGTLNDVAGAIGFHLRFSTEGADLAPTGAGFERALGRVVAIVAEAMTTGTWDRFKTCANDECQWVFYDNARNHSRRWCSMEVCGNRVKARSFRERQSHAP